MVTLLTMQSKLLVKISMLLPNDSQMKPKTLKKQLETSN